MLAKLNDVSLKTKLMIPLGILGLVMLGVMLWSFILLKDLDKINSNISKKYLHGTELILNADRDFYQVLEAERAMLILGKEHSSFTELLKAYNESKQQINERLKQFHDLAWSDEENQDLSLFFKQFESWSKSSQQVIDLVKKGDEQSLNEAQKLSFGVAASKFEEARATLDDLSESLEKNAAAQVGSAHSSAAKVETALVVGAIIMLAIIGVVIIFLPKVVTTSVFKIRDQLLELSQGDADLRARIDVKSADELGQLSSHFNDLMAMLQNLIREAQEKSQSISDLSAQLSQSSEATGKDTNELKNYMDMVATAIEELGGTAREIASNTTQAADNTQAADKEASNIQGMIERTVADMSSLADNVTEATDGVNILKGEADGISSVVDVIRGIAEQTNLLALNAAIEAARAGEQGRGFAVVADEVRSLASRTQESTADIQKMIEQVQAGVNKVVTVMEQGAGLAQSTLEHTNATNEALEAMTSMIVSVNDMMTQIATAAEEQSSVVEEINSNVVAMHDISERCERSAMESHEMSEMALTQSSNLNSTMEEFKV